MRIIYVLLVFSLFKPEAYSQITTFIQHIGNNNMQEEITQIAITSDGEYIITGGIASVLWYAKIDASGEILWSKYFNGGDYGSYGSSVIETADQGYLFGGEQKLDDPLGFAFSDALVIKTNESGDTLWTITWNSEDYNSRAEIRSIHETIDSNYLLIGNTNAELHSNRARAFSLLLNQNGEEIWTEIYDTHTFVVKSLETNDGGYLLGGIYGFPYSIFTYPFLAKISAQGDTIWTKINHLDLPFSAITGIVETSDSSIIIAGSAVLEDFSEAAFVSQLDPDGNLLWTRIYSTSTKTNSSSIILNQERNGYLFTGNNGDNIWLVNISENGDTLWTHTYTLAGQQFSKDVKLCQDGGFIIAGFDRAKLDGLLIKTDSLGRVEVITSTASPGFVDGRELKSFPNPALDNIYVELPQTVIPNNNSLTYTINDVAGKVIQTQRINALSKLIEIDISTLKNGLYILSIETDTHLYWSKFFKQ